MQEIQIGDKVMITGSSSTIGERKNYSGLSIGDTFIVDDIYEFHTFTWYAPKGGIKFLNGVHSDSIKLIKKKLNNIYNIGDTVRVTDIGKVFPSYDYAAKQMNVQFYNYDNSIKEGYTGNITGFMEHEYDSEGIIYAIDNKYIVGEEGIINIYGYGVADIHYNIKRIRSELNYYTTHQEIKNNTLSELNDILREKIYNDTKQGLLNSYTNNQPHPMQMATAISDRMNAKFFTNNKLDEITTIVEEIGVRIENINNTIDKFVKERNELRYINRSINNSVDSKNIKSTKDAMKKYEEFLEEEKKAFNDANK